VEASHASKHGTWNCVWTRGMFGSCSNTRMSTIIQTLYRQKACICICICKYICIYLYVCMIICGCIHTHTLHACASILYAMCCKIVGGARRATRQRTIPCLPAQQETMGIVDIQAAPPGPKHALAHNRCTLRWTIFVFVP
jgi:hypothetical protein